MSEIEIISEDELMLTLSADEIDKMLRRRIRQSKDAKMMPVHLLKMLNCYKKDGIKLRYILKENGDMLINLKDTTYGDIRDKFVLEKIFD